MDRLAREGAKFTAACAAAPVCSPTGASILSGQYPARVGISDFIPGHWRPRERLIVPISRTQHLPLETRRLPNSCRGRAAQPGILEFVQGYLKLIECFDDGSLELFDLRRDIGETSNLSAGLPVRAQELKEALALWRRSVGAELPSPHPDFDESRRSEWGRNPGRP